MTAATEDRFAAELVMAGLSHTQMTAVGEKLEAGWWTAFAVRDEADYQSDLWDDMCGLMAELQDAGTALLDARKLSHEADSAFTRPQPAVDVVPAEAPAQPAGLPEPVFCSGCGHGRCQHLDGCTVHGCQCAVVRSAVVPQAAHKLERLREATL